MTTEEYLSDLKRQHQALEKQIADAQAQGSSDDLKIAELKRGQIVPRGVV
jgi:hypothetical protein